MCRKLLAQQSVCNISIELIKTFFNIWIRAQISFNDSINGLPYWNEGLHTTWMTTKMLIWKIRLANLLSKLTICWWAWASCWFDDLSLSSKDAFSTHLTEYFSLRDNISILISAISALEKYDKKIKENFKNKIKLNKTLVPFKKN